MHEFWGLTEINKNDYSFDDNIFNLYDKKIEISSNEDCSRGISRIDEASSSEMNRKKRLTNVDLNSNGNFKKIECNSNENDLKSGLMKNENELKSEPDSNDFNSLPLSHNIPISDSERKAMICKNFARVYIQLDSFFYPMFWSLGPSKINKVLNDLKMKAKNVNDEKNKENKEKNTGRRSEQGKDKKISLSSHDLDIIFNPRRNTTPDFKEEEEEKEKLEMCKKLIDRDPLNLNFNEDEKYILFKYRNYYKKIAVALPIFLSSIEWTDPIQVDEMHKMLKTWAPLSPQEVIQ